MSSRARIVVFDADRYDRGLLALALRSADRECEVVKTATLLELMHALSIAPAAAVVADPGEHFTEVCAIVEFLRRREPRCQFWLFTTESGLPTAAQCVGHGIDGREVKDSAGYLEAPRRLQERLTACREGAARHAAELAALETSPLSGAAALLDGEGRVQAVNTAFEVTLGLPRYALIGAALGTLLAQHDFQSLLARGQPWSLQARVNGESPQLRICAGRPLEPGRRARGWWVVNAIALDSGAATTTGRDATADLEQMLYAVTHDLQAPLNSLVSNTRWLSGQTPSTDEEYTQTVEELAALGTRMQQMLDGLNEVVAVRAGRREPEVVSLDEVLDDAMANLQSELEDSGALIDRQPLPTLRVNRSQMVQVFQNLLSNALKFRGDHPPRIRITARETGDNVLRLVFADNGIGIASEDAGRIFGMFQRLHTEHEYPGLGIGLAVCRQIVRAHGGELSVESAPGQGASFMLEFPQRGMQSPAQSAEITEVDP